MFLRFFVIVSFVLSLVAAAGSFSIYQSYQSEREQRLEAESKFMQTQDSATTAKTDMEQQKSRIADLEGQIETLKKSEDEAKSQLSSKDTELQNAQAELSAKNDAAQKLQDQLDEMKRKERTPAPVMPPSAPANPIAAATAPVSMPLSSLPAAQTETQASASAVIPAESPASDDSRILTVNRKFNFIVVNLGLRDGLRMGDKVQVMQGSEQKALAQIEKIYDKFSAATLLNENKDNPVREGDAVRKA